MNRLTHQDVDRHVDVLYRTEPSHALGSWRPSFDALFDELNRARRIRNYCRIPTLLLAAGLVVLLHGERWDLGDIHGLLAAEFLTLWGVHLTLTHFFPTLRDEAIVASLLRYYGASVPPEEHEFA